MMFHLKHHILRPAVFVSKRSASGLSLYRVRASREDDQTDLDHAVRNVRLHDPSGYLPGRLLPTSIMTQSYYAVRSFWVETGLRFGTTARVAPHASPSEHLDWWQGGIDHVFESSSSQTLSTDFDHPTLRLIQSLRTANELCWERRRFDRLLRSRRDDLGVTQYETLDDLHEHAQRSCASLIALVLESGKMTESSNPEAHEAARLVGVTHGLTIALRTSIPVMSITGKIIIPADLCQKYGVRSPRYLLSALGQGDTECVIALQNAVRDITLSAREHLNEARALRSRIIAERNGSHAVAALLPGLVSETFLERLERANFQLTDRDLRNVGITEHASCSLRLISHYWKGAY